MATVQSFIADGLFIGTICSSWHSSWNWPRALTRHHAGSKSSRIYPTPALIRFLVPRVLVVQAARLVWLAGFKTRIGDDLEVPITASLKAPGG